jgi:uncharacterized SAM-binding protein YcdF (DUF218 family)
MNKAVNSVMKSLFLILGLVIFIIYACPLVAGILNEGNIFGMGVGFILALCGTFYDKIAKAVFQSSAIKTLVIAIAAVAVVFAIVFTSTLISVVSASHYSANNQTTVIVLGCRVRGDVPSLQLSKRSSEAAKYLEENPDAVAILSGGQGPDENISEAECMYNLITQAGISPSRLYIENESTSTDENIKFSKEIIEKNNLSKEIVVVTSDYHLKRAEIICKKNGLNAASIPASSSFYSLPTFYTREVFGVWVQWIKLGL